MQEENNLEDQQAVNSEEAEEEMELTKEANGELEETQNELANLKNEYEELNQRLLRVVAEGENVRKRYEKQIEETRTYSITSFAKELLLVVDNLTRALEHKPSSTTPDVMNLLQGIEMTKQEMLNVLGKFKMKAISPSVGDKFDYNLHSAVSQIADGNIPVGTVLQLVQPGYIIDDRLLRPAMVIVSKAQEN